MISNYLLGEKIDLFKTFDLAILDDTFKLGHVDPFLLFFGLLEH
jgi:hypothetical protein